MGRACSHSGLDGAPQQQATAALQSLGLATEEALENALPYLNFKEDLPSFPVSVKVALLRYFGEKKVQKEAQAGPKPAASHTAKETAEEGVAAILGRLGLARLLPVFTEHGITSRAALLLLDHNAMLNYMGISDLTARLKVVNYIQGESRKFFPHAAKQAPAPASTLKKEEDVGALFADLIVAHKRRKAAREKTQQYTEALVADVVREKYDEIMAKVDAAIDARAQAAAAARAEAETRAAATAVAAASGDDAAKAEARRLAASDAAADANLWLQDDKSQIVFGQAGDEIVLERTDKNNLKVGSNFTVAEKLSVNRGKTAPRVALDVGGKVAVRDSLSVGHTGMPKATLDVSGTAAITGEVTVGGDLVVEGDIVVDADAGTVGDVDVSAVEAKHVELEERLNALDREAVHHGLGKTQQLGEVSARSFSVSGGVKLAHGMRCAYMPQGADTDVCEADSDCPGGGNSCTKPPCSPDIEGALRYAPKNNPENPEETGVVEVCMGPWTGSHPDKTGTWSEVAPADKRRDKSKPYMRYGIWSSYNQNCCWIDDNSVDLFGGDNPSHWGDSDGRAERLSDTQRMYEFFNKPIECGWNCNINANSWYSYSSTNSKHTGVWMRLYNENSFQQRVRFYVRWTTYGGWSEQRSWGVWCNTNRLETRLGGHNRVTANNWGSPYQTRTTLEYDHPAGQYCNVIIIAASTQDSGHLRTTTLLFRENSLKQHPGIQYLSDFADVGFNHRSSNPY